MKQLLKRIIPASIIKNIYPFILMQKAHKKGLIIKRKADFLDIVNHSNIIRISSDHSVYLGDIIDSFDYYFSAVVPLRSQTNNIVDYSTPRYHDVVGYNAYPIMFPSFCEPMVTATQYLQFANLSKGMTVLDLGAYSGFTSILFSQVVGSTGTVVAVEADSSNISCINRNFSNYYKLTNIQISLIEGAVWNNCNGLKFSCEGNMGSSAESIIGKKRGQVTVVPTFTLNAISNLVNLKRVDFIKCDIEGAERVIFNDPEFFNKFLPRIIIEPHMVDNFDTTGQFTRDLSTYGYSCKRIIQEGVTLPLIECIPPD